MAPETRKHESGLRTQRITGPDVATTLRHTLPLPRMCPVSGNPQPGSVLAISYQGAPGGWCLEKYSVQHLLRRFERGWRGTPSYPAERNMEGAVRLLARMFADAVEVPVVVRARLRLDGGDRMTIRAEAA